MFQATDRLEIGAEFLVHQFEETDPTGIEPHARSVMARVGFRFQNRSLHAKQTKPLQECTSLARKFIWAKQGSQNATIARREVAMLS